MSGDQPTYEKTHSQYLRDKYTRLVSDLDEVRSFYREAEELYPYSNLSGEATVSKDYIIL